MRRSEIVGLCVDDLTFTEEGLSVLIQRSKTDQDGHGHLVGLPYGSNRITCPVRSVRAWLEEAQIDDGPLFPSMGRSEWPSGNALTGEMVCKILKAGLADIGVNPTSYGAHSLRSGFITAAAEKLRVEGFLSLYQYTLATASLLLACGLGLFWLRHTPVSRGISLALVVVGLGILVVDHLSEANAHRYYAALVAQDGAALQDRGAASNIAHSPPNAESDRAQ
jgi:hypothetical protein